MNVLMLSFFHACNQIRILYEGLICKVRYKDFIFYWFLIHHSPLSNLAYLIFSTIITSQFPQSTFLHQVLPFKFVNRIGIPNVIYMDIFYKIGKIFTNLHHGLVYHISLYHRILRTCSLSNQSLHKFQVPLNHPH